MTALATEMGGRVVESTKPGDRIGLPLFFVLLFLSWIGTVPIILSSYGARFPGVLKLLQILMLFGPGIAACFAAWMNGGRKGVRDLLRGLLIWRVHPAVYAAVLAGPALVFALVLILSNAAGFTAISFPSAAKFFSSFGMTMAVYLVLNTEELAWRGYALPRLQARMGPLPATLVLTILWILFHLPLFWIKGGHPAGYPFWLFALLIGGISIPFTAVYNGTGGSILMAHLLHQSFNASVEALPIFPAAIHSLAPIEITVALFFAVSAVLALRMRSL